MMEAKKTGLVKTGKSIPDPRCKGLKMGANLKVVGIVRRAL